MLLCASVFRKIAKKYITGEASFTWEEIKGDLFKVAMTGTSMWGSAKDFGTSYCFVAGTLVTTEDGQEPIEEIEVGDKVLSEDETTGEVAVKTVTETYVNETDELIHIGVNGETISATPTHPFYVDKLGWTLARSLRAGDVLVLSNGELVTVEWVQHEILENPIKVYNFEVEDFHTYFVGENGILFIMGVGIILGMIIRKNMLVKVRTGQNSQLNIMQLNLLNLLIIQTRFMQIHLILVYQQRVILLEIRTQGKY